jgi:AraC-like DNA-binding protein
MKPDTAASRGKPTRLDPVERAHLKDPGDSSHVMYRYPPPPHLAAVVQRFWVPVWSVPAGERSTQKVLQHPVCLLVVTPDYARFYGVTSGLSTTTLTGDGWAVGVMLTPAAGYLVAQAPLAAYADRAVDLTEIVGDQERDLRDRVRGAMADDPRSADGHALATAAYGDLLGEVGPVDTEGELVEQVVSFVDQHREVTRVRQVCDALDLSERALQRLVHRRIGLTPKWLIQRRRLHEAAELLRTRGMAQADIAAWLGYADQAHFVRDFARVTGMTPGRLAALHRTTP